MSDKQVPVKLQTFMYFIFKHLTNTQDLDEFLEECDITADEYLEIEEWFRNLGINLLSP
ncbi:hypothetical protein [Arsenophonus nasoniae]|uniref:EF-hand domain-containing protein n=1 Tax=Arsenophonus nasoniae TaxID=638 RepID=A0AA95K2A1_9GAMM|nr:hypothetical protein [Arsenophonus nasoniae]WGL95968.1 hypothetical protein QE207_05120 [Arsenophonus nasoniae]WGL96706.1 hypothetical protein QE207_09325 [Arsenophonus nasoniae]